MAVTKSAVRPQPAQVQPRRVDSPRTPVVVSGSKVRVGSTIGERKAAAAQPRVTTEAAPRDAARAVMGQRAATTAPGFANSQDKFSMGRPENSMAKILRGSPKLSGDSLPTPDEAIGFLTHFIQSTKK